jgi:polyisoprenoid-binding protein YceI
MAIGMTRGGRFMGTHATDARTATTIETTRWRIDPARSSIEFQVRGFWGLQVVKGGFTRYQGTLDLAADPAIELVIEADSLDTRNRKRDAHLRSADFFDAERHPYIRFVSDSAKLAGERLTVRGRLHARGKSMPLGLEATLRQVGDELALTAEAHADHHQLGMTWNPAGMIRTPSRLIVSGRLAQS